MERINLVVVVAALVVLVMSASTPRSEVGRYQLHMEDLSNASFEGPLYWVVTDTTTGTHYWRISNRGKEDRAWKKTLGPLEDE